MPPTGPASSSCVVAIQMKPLLVVAPDTLRAANFPFADQIDVPPIDEGIRRNGVGRGKDAIADIEHAGVGQRAADRQGRAAPVVLIVEVQKATVGQRSGRRHRGAVGSVNVAPSRSASPVRALFDPGAVLSSMKALVSAEGQSRTK